jgi:alpha-ketoglutaric semialdehyde dehydrogenase
MEFEMKLHGRNIVACRTLDGAGGSPAGSFTARGSLAIFEEANDQDLQLAFESAARDFEALRKITPDRRAAFIEQIGEEIFAIGDDLLVAAHTETGLPIAERLVGERERTINQLKMFAALIREGSWVDARIDHAIPERKPQKPDIRRLLIAIGPVAVFSASNFPLAFSVAGVDTASALAAGCPVVVKAHPAHPATSELTARAIMNAAEKTSMPGGVFSLLHSTRNEFAIAVVQHPLAKAVGFTGSLRGGRALFDAAARRPDPIPVYAEMGSVNPVFILPGALSERAEAIAKGLKSSVLVGTGQLCTCPGLAIGIGDENFMRFSKELQQLIAGSAAGPMLHAGILRAYEAGLERLAAIDGVETTQSAGPADPSKMEGRPAVFLTGPDTFMKHRALSEENFGPSTVVVRCRSREDIFAIARNLEGHLTATIHGTAQDLSDYAALISILEEKVGRIVFNGFPTGVELCPSMQHGGPYPATTDSKTTSVGTGAVLRFVRPVAYQNFPDGALPLELQNANPRGLWRLVDGQWTH